MKIKRNVEFELAMCMRANFYWFQSEIEKEKIDVLTKDKHKVHMAECRWYFIQ